MQVSLHHKGQVVEQGAPKTEGATPILAEIWVKRAELSIHIRRLSVGWCGSNEERG